MLGKIYKITNLINNKVYIGLTKKTLKERFSKHCWKANRNDTYHHNMAIKYAIRKYGKENFKIELIEECTFKELDNREKYWIEFYDSYNKGYNCTIGGQNGATRKTILSYDKELELIERRKNGYSLKYLSELYNIDRSTIINIFKRHEIKFPKIYCIVDRINVDDFRRYLSINPTINQISEKFNICTSSVRNFIKRNNIEYNFPKSVKTLTSKVEG